MSDYEAVGKAAKDYCDTEQEIASLTHHLSITASHLGELERMLSGSPSEITTGESFEIPATALYPAAKEGKIMSVPFSALDAEVISTTLKCLGRARENRNRLIKDLKTLGLQDLVKPSDPYENL